MYTYYGILQAELYRRTFLKLGHYCVTHTYHAASVRDCSHAQAGIPFNGYIHVKGIPGADPSVIEETGWYVDRMSVNLELATAEALRSIAPNKSRRNILTPMKQIQLGIQRNEQLLSDYHSSYGYNTVAARRQGFPESAGDFCKIQAHS